MSPIDNPEYRAQADKLVESAQKVKLAAEEHGIKSTAFTMALLGEMLTISTAVGTFAALPKDQRDEFLAEVWDAAIGNEPKALVNQIAFFDPDTTEALSDALKAGALAYFNRSLSVPA